MSKTRQETLLEGQSIHVWLMNNGMLQETGKEVDFRQHLFLYDIYRDFSPKLVCMKAAQVGFSTLAIFKLFWMTKYRKMDTVYVLPTANDIKDFVGGKVNRIISQNPILQEWTADKDSIEQKKVGENVIYYRGSFTERAALMISADVLIIDEIDRCDQAVVAQYESRLQHSKHAWTWVFSNPSALGNGVSRYWGKSDQMKWHITCEKCQVEHYMEFPKSFNLEKKTYICKHCNEELTERSRINGNWKATNPGAEWRGYWIPLYIAPWVTAAKIIDLWETKSPEYFANFVEGLPFVGGGNTITEEDVMQNVKEERNDASGRIIIGVDTGITNWYVMGNEQGIFYHGKCNDYVELDKHMQTYKNAIMVVDQGGDLIGSRLLREKYPGRVFLCHYSNDRKTIQLVRWGEGEEYGNVVVDRNRILQMVVDHLREKRLPLFGTKEDWYALWLHLQHVFRTQAEDGLGVVRYKWERSGPDHLFHALGYFMVGITKFSSGGKLLSNFSSKLSPNSYMLNLNNSVSFNPETFFDDLEKANSEDEWRI
jgi:hypothetical protein